MERPTLSMSSSIDDDLYISASVNDILEVSPVNTFDLQLEGLEGSPLRDADRHRSVLPVSVSATEEEEEAKNAARRNEDAFSSSSSGGGSSSGEDDNDDEGGGGQDSDEESAGDSTHSDDEGGESEDESDGEEDSYSSSDTSTANKQDQSKARRKRKSFTSEFDRAMHRGKGRPSRANLDPTAFATSTSTGSAAGSTTSTPVVTPALAYNQASPPPPPPQTKKSGRSLAAPTISNSASNQSTDALAVSASATNTLNAPGTVSTVSVPEDPLASGVLPDVLMTMRQKIESLTLFDSDMMKLAQGGYESNPHHHFYYPDDAADRETRESLKRSSQQSISAAVLVSLAHKRYERRRLAAMEIEKVVRSLVQQQELERVRAILLLLSDDYVRSTSEDARKGGVVALAASAIGLKKAPESNRMALECRDLILASVVHACQDHSQRVRYYATESLFNVVKVIPSLAVQHFFILFEILRSLYADVDVDVKSGAELLDKKLKEVIVGAMNSGQFTADACVPVFARFVYMRNKATKRLTLTWLQELAEKLIGAPILEFLHLLLGGIFDMVADPTLAIRQSALAFLQSVLPKLLTVDDHVQEEAIDDMGQGGMKVDFDKILQSLVTTMEHPDPFVRKVAMYWMSRIVKAHIDGPAENKVAGRKHDQTPHDHDDDKRSPKSRPQLSAATISVRNSLPHVLPGILLSIGDTFKSNNAVKDSFLPDQTTHALAEQTNACLQDAVRRDGQAYVHHLDSFIVALREELDAPGGINARNPPAIERKPYRMDVKHDGTGIESQGWFRASNDTKQDDVESMMLSRLCALHWVIVLYESVVPDVLKADYAREFVIPIIHQLVDHPPEQIIYKSLEVLATITVPVNGEPTTSKDKTTTSNSTEMDDCDHEDETPMTEHSVNFALDILDQNRRQLQSRDREVFAVLIQLHAYNLHLIGDVAKIIAYMCRLQPPEFVFVSFAVELERFVVKQSKSSNTRGQNKQPLSRDLQFVASFIQQMCHVLLNSRETKSLRDVLKECIGSKTDSERDLRRARLFHILLHCFSHNLVASTGLCLWGGAFRTASLFLRNIDPLDIHLMFLLELDKLVEMMERPLFRHLHVRMLDSDKEPLAEGSGTMLFQVLKSLLMILPQSTCYNLLRNRLTSTSRFRQSVVALNANNTNVWLSKETEIFVNRVLDVRQMHCAALWETIRVESLETEMTDAQKEEEKKQEHHEDGSDRRNWLGYASKEEERIAQARYREEKRRRQASGVTIEEISTNYNDLNSINTDGIRTNDFISNQEDNESWKDFWALKK